METPVAMTARFRLAQLLEESGLSQRELAARAGVSPTTVNRMASNLTAQVALETLDALSRELGKALGREVAPGDLIERERKGRKG
jgi:DNA-binding Xre family transcriptional regulator